MIMSPDHILAEPAFDVVENQMMHNSNAKNDPRQQYSQTQFHPM